MDSFNRTKMTIFTDGSCTVKGRKEGGFGVYLKQGEAEITYRKGFWNTTTTRMEMKALLAAIEMVDSEVWTDVRIISDSQFVVNAFLLGWLNQWRLNCWQGVKNPELWNKIIKAIECRRKMKFNITWTPGHGKDLEQDYVFGNSVADSLANYKTQDSYEQDLDLVGYSWFHHDSSDCVFIEKTDRYEELNVMGDVYDIGPCYRANFEELFERCNGTHLFEALYNGTLDINYEIKEII